ncbi:hypothetical protein SDC9_133436 [bioreactor metagenome]|uniref:HTH luxR-type domain-containing protein n=1 Tax=bioreactor metagenome TaxID=1076179 RepID=A0A645DAY3_9ZZZZ
MAELRAAIALRTQQTKLWTQASDSLFEPLGEVALLATPRGYITHCAPHARERLSGEGGIVREEQLWHRSTGIRQRLHHALAQAAAGMRCVPVHIPALGGAAPSMRVDFTRADPRLGMMNETLVFVRVRFADMPADVSVELLRQAFPITQAEAQVLASLIRGETTKDIVVRTGASIHTVRKQISMLMTKMECTRQLELVSKARALF